MSWSRISLASAEQSFHPDRDVFIHALAETMPQCDRKRDLTTIGDLAPLQPEEERNCYVYCAQRTCSAAEAFVEDGDNRKTLSEGCKSVFVVEDGSLGMRADELTDGNACHKSILDYNRSRRLGTDEGSPAHCVGCTTERTAIIPLTIDDVSSKGALVDSKDEIPSWFLSEGIYSALPPHISCSARGSAYKPLGKDPPVTETRCGSEIVMDTSGSSVPANATIAYWAATPSDVGDREAASAYGDFSNSGIAKCDEHECKMRVSLPSSYAEEGVLYEPHLHFTVWNGDSWDLNVKTVVLPPWK